MKRGDKDKESEMSRERRLFMCKCSYCGRCVEDLGVICVATVIIAKQDIKAARRYVKGRGEKIHDKRRINGRFKAGRKWS